MDTVTEGSWYAETVVHVARSDAPDHEPLYSETMVLLHAADEEKAAARALEWAKAQEHSYVNADGERITWSVETVSRSVPWPTEGPEPFMITG